MTIRMDQLIKALTTALDIVEGELLGASSRHGKRVAVLSGIMGLRLGMRDEELRALTTCALLHDNALTEYIASELDGEEHDAAMKSHCEIGQRNVNTLNFKTNYSDFVLYHHERPNGTGSFQKREGEFSTGAAIICIADTVDVINHLQRIRSERLPDIYRYIESGAGTLFTREAAEAMLGILDENMLETLQDENIEDAALKFIPAWYAEMENEVIINLATFFTHIIDYKSKFTRKHSTQIANRAWLMACRYGYPLSTCTEIYLAAALHDLGKLAISSSILEKPGKLDDEEFEIIKSHVYKTWEILKDIEGFEEIHLWASNHHEKLDGTGYPFGKKAEDLDFVSRLLACIDIYQAVSEDRPYHAGRGHGETIGILRDMARKGFIDRDITEDLNKMLLDFDGQDVPPPDLEACREARKTEV
jgi:HD-GYP domain-containing protein (c-di-GMP phosphodiesterase class II)